MEKTGKKPELLEIKCPLCQGVLWIDLSSRSVIRCDKGKKEKGSLDDLLQLEKKRKQEFSQKFEATTELEREKRKKAEEKFARALTDLNEKN